MGLSAKEAAQAVGISKQGIIKSITRGRISAVKNKNGEWEIDPAELFRVYDIVKSVDPVDTSTNSECISQSPPDIQPKANALEDKIVSLEERNRRLEEQLVKAEKREEWLMAANDKLTQVLESQTRLLEYAPEPIEKKREVWFRWFRR